MLFEFDLDDKLKDFVNLEDDKKKDNLFNDINGLEYGNMFKDLYDEYKNYKPKKIYASNQKEALLLKIMMLDFAINDLNLYLILNPNDKNTFNKFKEYIKDYKMYKKEYEDKYQVIELCDDTKDKYTFNSNPWPWEGMYV